MPEPVIDPAAITQNPAEDASLIESAGDTTLLNSATDADKQAQEAENQRLLAADEATLSEEDKGKRTVLVKAQEEKRLLETPEDKLSPEDKVKKADLVKAQQAQEVPEKYEFKVPEGMTLNQAFADKISPVLKELKISQAGAQKLADVYAEQIKADADAEAAGFKQFLKDSADETIKALGANYKEQLSFVAKVRDRFLSAETQEMLDASGLSNNKALILDLIKIGKLVSEDKLAAGTTAAPTGAKSAAEQLYPNQGK